VRTWVLGRKRDVPKRLTDEIITAAIDGFEAQKTRLDEQIAKLRALLSGNSAHSPAALGPAPPKRRKMSTAARRRIAMAQRARWAKVRGETEPAAPRQKPKRRLSAAGRKAIIAATKRRWALRRLEAAKTKKAARKKAVVKKVAVKGAKRRAQVRKLAA
jgi:hypothetical protein